MKVVTGATAGCVT